MVVLRPTLVADDAVAVLQVAADAPGGGGSSGTLHVGIAMLGGDGSLMLQQTGGKASALRLRGHLLVPREERT